MELYNKLLKVNKIPLEYPFNEKIEDNIEFTKNQLTIYYIKKYNKCIEESKKEKLGGKTEKSLIYVFLQ